MKKKEKSKLFSCIYLFIVFSAVSMVPSDSIFIVD